ncbi:MAG: ferritin family protein [Candidatus Omnitrophica bacterium]|nr:ferritin family protein [Candidatus Omnitrophota bacterium]MDD5592201.1 ferritin family protein [Candidatus Omnitrophota bacterium]
MGNIFAASEILEIGIQIERNGRDFYGVLTGEAKNPKSRKMFEYLSAEEEKHALIFQKMLDAIQKYEPTEAYPGEYFAYMRALAAENVFTQAVKGKEMAAKVKSDKEAINIGIGVEKDSIIFYEGMKKIVPEYDQTIVDEVIAQEKDHLEKLLDLKANL